jgi:hypothetical protein
VGTVGFLGVVYLCFDGNWNWVSIFFISLNPVLMYFLGENVFHPFCLPITPLGVVIVPGFCVI